MRRDDPWAALSEPVAHRVFEEVVQNRLIRMGALLKRVEDVADRQSIRKTLEALKEAQLIAEKPSAVEDFTTYYVTAEGLEASRKTGKMRR